MKDILNKVLAANADTDAVAKVIDTVVNTPRQDVQPKTDKEVAIKRSLAVEEALAKTVHKLDDDTDSVANADANCIVNVDAAGNGKDKSDRAVVTRDANGRIVELRGNANDAPDELY